MTIFEIEEINERIARDELVYYGGNLVEEEFCSGLISANGHFAYQIKDEIFLLMENLAVVINPLALKAPADPYKEAKKVVSAFYDNFGWRRDEQGQFLDSLKNKDPRPLSQEYIRKTDRRIRKHIKNRGKYILDVASGPVHSDEYTNCYDLQICMDLSFLALQEAKRKLSVRGGYILGDVTTIPLADNCVDAVISLHTIYHVPAEQQEKAFQEIHRVLSPGSTAVVAYSWGGHSIFMKAASALARAVPASFRRFLKTMLRSDTEAPRIMDSPDSLYFHAHPYRWFARKDWKFRFDILVLRSVNVYFLKTFIHERFFGKKLLALIHWLEENFPRMAGRFGQYPLFVINK